MFFNKIVMDEKIVFSINHNVEHLPLSSSYILIFIHFFDICFTILIRNYWSQFDGRCHYNSILRTWKTAPLYRALLPPLLIYTYIHRNNRNFHNTRISRTLPFSQSFDRHYLCFFFNIQVRIPSCVWTNLVKRLYSIYIYIIVNEYSDDGNEKLKSLLLLRIKVVANWKLKRFL